MINKSSPKTQLKNHKEAINTDEALVNLIEALKDIDTRRPIAKLNSTSISDNNGGRITL